MTIYGYARVSTLKQDLYGNGLEAQIIELKQAGATEVYQDSSNGYKIDRPNFNQLLSKVESGDTIMVTKLDRFCRTAKEGLEIIDGLMNKDIKIHILDMGLIENTPVGRLILTNLLAFAEFERRTILERTRIGKEIAKSKPGFKEGRPKKFTPRQMDNALSMLSINGGKYSYKQVEELLNISKSTLIRENNRRKALKEQKKE